jgi:hypothetical protein
MADIKISALPQATSVATSDIFPTVAGSTTSKITTKNLANSLPQVSSSISASYVLQAVSASFATNTVSASYSVSSTSSSYALSASYALSTNIQIESFATTGSNTFAGNQTISGSIKLTGSLDSTITGSISHALSFGTLTIDQSALSGSNAFVVKYAPVGYSTYYIFANQSYNSSSSLYMYPMTTNGSTLKSPVYSSKITIANMNGGNNLRINVNPADTGIGLALLSTGPNTLYDDYVVPAGKFIDMFFDTSNLRWTIMNSGSL